VADAPLSVCMVTTFFPPHNFGGDGIHVYRLSNELARRGHAVTVVYPRDAYRLFSRVEPADTYPLEPGVTIVPVRSSAGRLGPVSSYLTGRPALMARALTDAVGRGHDVVHFHNVSLAGGAGVLRVGEGVKLYTTNEHWLVCPMHVLWKMNREPCEKPQCLRCQLAFHRPPQLWRYGGLLDRATSEVDLFLSPSRFTIDAHRARGFTRPMRHLPYFLPASEARAPEPAEAGGRPYILFVGRIVALKGLDRLLEAFRTYDAVDLVVVGEGDERRRLERSAADLPHVRFLGRKHPSELPELYAGALALVVPSVGYEVFGIVVLEAFAQGTPAIVSDLGALPELIADSGGGLTFRTTAELIDSIDRLRVDRALRDELGRRGRAAWLERWSEGPHIDAYMRAIADVRRSTA